MADPIIQRQAERAAGLAIRLNAKLEGEQHPNLRKVGRYAFFAPCALGFGALAGAMFHRIGAGSDATGIAASMISFVAFLALRDMSQTWDLAVYAAAETQAHLDRLMERGSEA